MARRYARKFKRSYKKFGKRKSRYGGGRRRVNRASGRRLNSLSGDMFDKAARQSGGYNSAKGYTAQRLFPPMSLPASAPVRGRGGLSEVRRLGENSSLSACYLGKSSRGMRYLQSKAGGIKRTYQNNVGQLNTGTGTQSVISYISLPRLELIACKTALNADLPAEFKTGNNNMKIIFREVRQKMHIKNQTNHVATVTLYNIIPKAAVLTALIDSPEEAWVKGCTDQGMSGYSQLPGRGPYESKEFTKHFSVVKTTKLFLEPGEQHEHNFVRKINRVFDSTLWDDANLNIGETIKGLTAFTMLVAYGSLGHSSTDVGTTVSYMPVRLDIVNHLEYAYQFYELGKKTTVLTSNNLLGVAPADWDFIADAGDIEGNLVPA